MSNGNNNGMSLGVKILFGVVMALAGSMVTSWASSWQEDATAERIERKIDQLASEFRGFKEDMTREVAVLKVKVEVLERGR